VYAEGLPAIKDAQAVDILARHMVDDARHLAVLQMWMETERPISSRSIRFAQLAAPEFRSRC
jgi:hypothetical protein